MPSNKYDNYEPNWCTCITTLTEADATNVWLYNSGQWNASDDSMLEIPLEHCLSDVIILMAPF